jgi:hypothetical protein
MQISNAEAVDGMSGLGLCQWTVAGTAATVACNDYSVTE